MLHSEGFRRGGLGGMSRQILGGDERAAQPGEHVSDGKGCLVWYQGARARRAAMSSVIGGLAASVVTHRCL